MISSKQSQTSGENSTNIQANEYNHTNNYYHKPSDETDFGILAEIIDYIIERIPEVEPRKRSKSGNFTNLKTKAELNFPDMDEHETFREVILHHWERKSLVEEFIKIETENNPTKVEALIDKIQSDFRNLKQSTSHRKKIEKNKIIEDMALDYLPVNKKKNPEYIANAKAIVLYFFEFCHFGKSTESEQKKIDSFWG